MTKKAKCWLRHLQAIEQHGISAAAYARGNNLPDYKGSSVNHR